MVYNALSHSSLRDNPYLEKLVSFGNFVKTFTNNTIIMDDTKSELLTAKDVAKIFGVHPYTVYNWIRKGAIKAIRLEGSNRFFIDKAELNKVKNKK